MFNGMLDDFEINLYVVFDFVKRFFGVMKNSEVRNFRGSGDLQFYVILMLNVFFMSLKQNSVFNSMLQSSDVWQKREGKLEEFYVQVDLF